MSDFNPEILRSPEIMEEATAGVLESFEGIAADLDDCNADLLGFSTKTLELSKEELLYRYRSLVIFVSEHDNTMEDLKEYLTMIRPILEAANADKNSREAFISEVVDTNN